MPHDSGGKTIVVGARVHSHGLTGTVQEICGNRVESKGQVVGHQTIVRVLWDAFEELNLPEDLTLVPRSVGQVVWLVESGPGYSVVSKKVTSEKLVGLYTYYTFEDGSEIDAQFTFSSRGPADEVAERAKAWRDDVVSVQKAEQSR